MQESEKRRMIYLALALVGIAVLLFISKAQAQTILSSAYIESLIKTTAASVGVDKALALAIAQVESNFNPSAKNPADPSFGLFQITPMLAQDYGYVKDWHSPTISEIQSLYDVSINTSIACRHIRRLSLLYLLDTVIQMYNVGETGYLKGKRVPDYLAKVRKAYDKYSKEG